MGSHWCSLPGSSCRGCSRSMEDASLTGWKRQVSRCPPRLGVLLAAFCAAAVLSSCTGGKPRAGTPEGSPPQADSTSSTSPSAKVARSLGPPPRGCGAPRLPRSEVSPNYAPLLGRAPVWFGPYLSVDARRSAFRVLADAPRTEHGWRVKFLWVIGPRQEAPVTLRGRDLSGEHQLPLELEGAEVAASATLDPERPGALPEDPAGGCYFLEASWPGGSWKIAFAVGR
jgi:hypothetical protein